MTATSPAFDTLLQGALRLPLEERSRMASRLIESIEEGEDVEISAAWREEIDRRIASIEDGSARLIPHEEVMEAVQLRLAELRQAHSA